MISRFFILLILCVILTDCMALRFRKITSDPDLESGSPEITSILNRNVELETLVTGLKQMLDTSRYRERQLVRALEELGGSVDLTPDESGLGSFFDNSTFLQGLLNRSSWLIGLLIFQSFSSYILSNNEELLQNHPSIVFYLTMLVGAGGNAGNQATVRVIRELAVGSLIGKAKIDFILREMLMAVALSAIVGVFGFVRVYVFSDVSLPESIAITIALISIVLMSVVVGALLPLIFQTIGLDPANSSTTIQVIMDISGVLITCMVATTVLDSSIGNYLMNKLNSLIEKRGTS